jgi:hypothetical protein
MTDMDTRLANLQAGILPDQPRGDHPSASSSSSPSTTSTVPAPATDHLVVHSYPSPVHGDPIFPPTSLDTSASLSFSPLNQSPDHHSSLSPQPNNALSGDTTPVDMLAVASTPPLITSIPSMQGTVSAATAAAMAAGSAILREHPSGYPSDFTPPPPPPPPSSSSAAAAEAAANGTSSTSVSAFSMNVDIDHSPAATLPPSSIIASPELLQGLTPSSHQQQSKSEQHQQTPFSSAGISPFALMPHLVSGAPPTTLSESASSMGGFSFPPTDVPPLTATTAASTPGSSSDNAAEDGHMLAVDNMLDA